MSVDWVEYFGGIPLEAIHSIRPLHILLNTRTEEVQGADKAAVGQIFESALWTRDLFFRECSYRAPGCQSSFSYIYIGINILHSIANTSTASTEMHLFYKIIFIQNIYISLKFFHKYF